MTDPQKFEGFMSAYQDMVYSTALRLVGKEQEAEDIAQEVFLKAYERYADLSTSPTVGGWLKTVARNLSINHLQRYRNRWRFFSEMSSADEDHERDFAAELVAPETHAAHLDTSDQHHLLQEALNKLPENQRIPLVLYHFEDLDYQDIAARLNISLGKVKTDIHRGRDALRKKLGVRLNELALS